MQKQKTGKISIFSSLDIKLKFLTNQVELTQFSVESSRVELKIWATQLELSWKCKQLDLILIQVQNVNSKLDLIISLKVIKRNYYWSFMRKTIDWYIRNCYICQRSKTFRNKSNDLLQSLLISEQRWQDIAMNFIIDLSDSYDYNAILTVICKLSKKRHYISCIIDDEDITVERTAEMLIQWVYWTHDLSSFIVFDRDTQFTFILWKSLCKRLSISLQLFNVYHSQINDQSEQVNQNVERYLHSFCLYMQNDWFKWLLMIKFVNNNVLSSVIFLTFFFMNKNFYSRMNFDSDIIEYESIRERLQIVRIEDIFKHMNKTLIFAREALIKTRKRMMKQANKHRKKINYKIESKMFLNERNIVTVRLFKKLDDKMLDSFKITDSVDFFYKLLIETIKHYAYTWCISFKVSSFCRWWLSVWSEEWILKINSDKQWEWMRDWRYIELSMISKKTSISS